MGFLTPETLATGTTCRTLVFPDDQRVIANLTGALELLTLSDWYSPFGALTPEESAAQMLPVFNSFCFNEGTCRMIGEIVPYAGSSSPKANWLLCDGSSLLRADYPDLFTVVGIAYGSVDISHFNIPDMRDRTPVGAGSTYSVAQTFGESAHTLTNSESPAHSHSDYGHLHAIVGASPFVASIAPGVPVPVAVPLPMSSALGFANLESSGGGGAHNNIQPSIAISYLIVAK